MATCLRCHHFFDRAAELARSVDMAWAVAILVLLIPANLLPVASTSFGSVTHYAWIASMATAVWAQRWPVLGLMLGAYTVVFPFIWVSLLTVVLVTLHTRRKPAWLGRAFRYAQSIHLWAMPDVLVIAGFVIYMRTSQQLTTRLQPGGWCLIGAGLLALLWPRIVAPHAIWSAIAPDLDPPKNELSVSCVACGLVVPIARVDEPCPRCRRRLRLPDRSDIRRSAALVATGYFLFFLAYYYPMSYTIQPNGRIDRTIFTGMKELIQAGFWYLGVIILIASFLIPLLKLIGLTWLLISASRRSRSRLVFKTRLHRLIHHIGRWSNIDPFIVAMSVPLMSFPGIVSVHATTAALPFTVIVAVTMVAARSFDPRLLWTAGETARD